ncbi:MAG: NfeD family protein, partial [Dehalococcoidia bacterium]|nr:NfeD family protein [Dehalococcoidia bacterium]
LVLFSMVLFFLELQEPGIGIFGIGGAVSLVLAAFLLFGNVFDAPDIPEPSFRVSTWLIAIVGGVGALLVFFLYRARTMGSQMDYVPDFQTSLVGLRGVALSELGPTGTVRVADKDWTATTTPGDLIREGEEVKVDEVYGSVLKVSRC